MSKTAQALLSEIDPGKVLERLRTCGGYYSTHFQPHYRGIRLCLRLLRNAIERCLLDLKYVKNFHGIEYADQHKRAAFSMYWLSKVKPIQIDSSANIVSSHLVINEIFGIHIGLDHLEINIDDITPEYFVHLLYTLHNRNISPEELSSEMYVLECSVLKKKP